MEVQVLVCVSFMTCPFALCERTNLLFEEVVASRDGIHGPAEALQAALNERTALLTLSHTVFKSGYMYDMAEMTTTAHRAGALVLWDLSHSVGSVVIDLNAAGAESGGWLHL